MKYKRLASGLIATAVAIGTTFATTGTAHAVSGCSISYVEDGGVGVYRYGAHVNCAVSASTYWYFRIWCESASGGQEYTKSTSQRKGAGQATLWCTNVNDFVTDAYTF
ncbi:hypothetical protein [Microbispora rosea]|uniref:hypothetical protein n=1 Tax=Microbispora rosea TaxID=58117 RepID=UPI0012DCD73E|nr:hypothetical protein [Microbispora rosea]